ncbi:sugar ABC transporter permease [Eubacteriales bacterium OttesenSCG-928-N13]|nr:sugar ABC transporter permease [Eubacteriales bacterium OttesenSCG-928-N13]
MKSRRLRPSLADNAVGYLFLAPWLIGFLGLTLYPMIQSLYYSFTQFDMMSPPEWVGFANYIKMFTADKTYMKSLQVTFTYVLWAVPLKLIFALLIAMLMNQKLRFIGLYRAVYYIPTLLGGSVAIAMLWKRLFSGDGAINTILRALGWANPPAWIANPNYALATLVLLTVWQFGSSMIIFLAGLKQIPDEYYEAASVDGAGPITKFFRITLPSLSPVILFNLVMQMISAFQAFTQAFIISAGKGGPLDSTMFYTLYLYTKGFYYYEMGYASAMAWVLLIIIGILTAIIFKSSNMWVSYGSGD